MIEIAVAMICACLPSLRALLSRFIPALFGKSLTYATYSSRTSSRKLGGGGGGGGGGGTTQSATGYNDYKGSKLSDSTANADGDVHWKDQSVVHVTTVTTVKAHQAPPGAQSMVSDTTPILSIGTTTPDVLSSLPRRAGGDDDDDEAKPGEEITFLHMGQQDIPMGRLNRSQSVARQDASSSIKC